MKVISEDVENNLWNKLYNEYKFSPGMNILDDWIRIPGNIKVYHKETPWDDMQESLINSFLEELVNGKMYALDWHHDCFEFSPDEHIPIDYNYYDSDRQCQVYFPTYYPNGDYYLFFNKDWTYGIFGNPWRHEIIVMGKELIKKFDENQVELGFRLR